MINIKLPDGSVREYEAGVSVYDITKDISEGLLRSALGAVVNGEVLGMKDTVVEDADFKIVNFDDEEGKHIFWHTTSHVMAYAIQNLFPNVKFAIGPAIDNGFYYDIDTDYRFVPEDLEKIEAEMKKIIKEGYEVNRIEISKADAIARFEPMGEIYKVELIEALPDDEVITLYQIGDFVDLCRGPHLMDIKKIKAIKLLSIAGAYWRGDEKNKMLQRIYGVSFDKKKNLDEYLERLEEAQKRDHRKLGKELDLFSIHEEGPGFPFFHPKGMILRNEIEYFLRDELIKAGYGEIKTPLILNESLWHRSGHWDHYKDNMYFTKIDGEDYAIKPMNCPGSILVYKSNMYSYRDLPLRLSEFGQVHRHELSGALHGLFRVRTFTQDDAHHFMLPSQIKDEIVGIIDLIDRVYKVFGFNYKVELSTKPETAMGSDEQWEIATNSLIEALAAKDMDYKLNEGDGAFYGPKIDFHIEDAIGRTWQCGTIQLDFQMPERFELEYVAQSGKKERPVMVHRTVMGSFERFMGVLIEHFAGKFPLWLAPVQIEVVPVSEKFLDYAREVEAFFKEDKFRVHTDARNEKLGYKIREAQMMKVPYVFVVGEKEMNDKTVSVRRLGGEDLGSFALEDIKRELRVEVDEKRIQE